MKDSKYQIKFTKSVLDRLPIPERSHVTYNDTVERKLKLYVSHSGSKIFQIRRKAKGEDKRIRVGVYPYISIQEARKRVWQLESKFELDSNLFDEQEETPKESKTFKEAFQLYYNRHVVDKNKKGTVRKDIIHRMNKILPILGNRDIETITTPGLIKLHSEIGKKYGHYTANRAIAYIRAIFNKMIQWGFAEKNPAIGVEKFREQKRERFVSYEELPILLNALKQDPNPDVRDFFLMCLYTGARKSNVLSMRWEDIDFGMKVWCIPDTKNGEPLPVPLAEQAIEVLKGRLHLKGSSNWVFPSPLSKSGHLEEPKAAWSRVLERAGLKNLRIHDLRRTLATYLASNGMSLPMIGRVLGHKSPQSTSIYAKIALGPLREGMVKTLNLALGSNEVSDEKEYNLK